MKKLSVFSFLLLFNISIKAQIYGPVKWSYAAKKISANEAIIYFKAVIGDDWHMYSINQGPGGPLKTTFSFLTSPDFILNGPTVEPKPKSKFDKTFEIEVDYFEKEVVFQQKIKLKKQETVVKGKVEFMACTKERCMPLAEVDFSILVK